MDYDNDEKERERDKYIRRIEARCKDPEVLRKCEENQRINDRAVHKKIFGY